MITVYCDKKRYELTLEELKLKNWNVLVNKTNGYSHDWVEIYPFEEKYIKNIGGSPTIWCTAKKCGVLHGSDRVSNT